MPLTDVTYGLLQLPREVEPGVCLRPGTIQKHFWHGVDGADVRGAGGRGAKRRLFDDGAGGGEDDARGADAEVTDKEVGAAEAGAVYVRDGLRGSAEGEAVWWAGRRRRSMRLRDVRVARECQMGCGELVTIAHGNVKIHKRLRTSFGQETVGTGAAVHGDDEVDRRALEDAVVEAGSGRGMYVVGSRWHGGTMIAMLRQMESATYGWRYGGIG